MRSKQLKVVNGRRLGVRDRDAVPDAGTQDLFPFLDCGQDPGWVATGAFGKELSEFADDARLVARLEGDFDPVRRQQFGQQQSAVVSRGTQANLTGPTKPCKRFRD